MARLETWIVSGLTIVRRGHGAITLPLPPVTTDGLGLQPLGTSALGGA